MELRVVLLVISTLMYCYCQTITTVPESVYAPAFRTAASSVTCGSDLDWFQTPCYNSRQYSTSFYQPNSTIIRNSGFLSLAASNVAGDVPHIFAGLNTNYILNIRVPTGQPIVATQTIVPANVASNLQGNWSVAVTDSAGTMVLFGSSQSSGAAIVKFTIDQVSGNLTQTTSNVNLAGTNLVNLASSYYNPTTKQFYFGGDNGIVVKVDPTTLAPTVVQTTASGSIQCITGTGANMLMGSDDGEVVAVVSGSTDNVVGVLSIPNEGFGGACGSTSTFAMFAGLSSGNIYQLSYPGVSINGVSYGNTAPKIVYSMSYMMPNAYFFVGAMNADATAFYIASTQAALPINTRVTEIVYEFRLYADRFDYSTSITNSKQPSMTNIYSSASIGDSIFWGTYINLNVNFTLGQPFLAGEVFFMVSSSLASQPTATKLMPNYKIPTAPSSAIGFTGSIADTKQYIATSDILAACGIGVFPGNSTPSPVPPRGPITTYIRGTNTITSDGSHGGEFVNNQTMALQLIGVDEVSQNYFSPVNSSSHLIYRSIPFLSSTDAPWAGSLQPSKMTWVLGTAYPYPIPPAITIVNGSFLPTPGNPTPPVTNTNSTMRRSAISYKLSPVFEDHSDTNVAAGGRKQRSLNIAGPSLPGYTGFQVDLLAYDALYNPPTTINYNYDPANNLSVGYNTTSRTLSYTISVSQWTFLQIARDVPTLRVNISVGFGASGTDLVGVTTQSYNYNNVSGSVFANQTFVQRITFQMNTCYWTLVLPQVANTYPGGLVPVTFPTVYDNTTGIVSIYLPTYATSTVSGQTKGVIQNYQFFVEYDFNPPPALPNIDNSKTPTWKKLIPLYIVVGVCLGIILLIACVALIVGAVIGIIKYRRWRDRLVEDKLSKSDQMLANDL